MKSTWGRCPVVRTRTWGRCPVVPKDCRAGPEAAGLVVPEAAGLVVPKDCRAGLEAAGLAVAAAV